MALCVRLDQSSPVDPLQVAAALIDIANTISLFALATVSKGARAHINNCYFYFTEHLEFGFLSFDDTEHIRNIQNSAYAAVAIASTAHEWGAPIRGVQFDGEVKKVPKRGRPAFFRDYSKRFPAAREYCAELLNSSSLDQAQPYMFFPSTFVIVDEIRFGEENFLGGRIERVLAR